MTTPAKTVSAQHLFACRANYILNVAPAFQANKAFASHFCDSYLLMNSRSPESGELPAGFGLLLLGVRAHAVLPASFSGLLRSHKDLLGRLGLESRAMSSGAVEVFDRRAIALPLETITGIAPSGGASVRKGLEMLETRFNTGERRPYELVAWPSLVSPTDVFSIHRIDTYSGVMTFPSKESEFLNTGVLVSTAVAVVEQMMGKLKSLPKAVRFFTESTVAPVCDVPA